MISALGVVVLGFNSSEVILDCLASLLASDGVALRVVLVDNASTDGTVGLVRDWMAGRRVHVPPPDLPFALDASPPAAGGPHRLEIVETGVNGGFAGGVNAGIARLLADPAIDRVWILNPDSLVPPGTARALAEAPGGFSLMGGRLAYLDGDRRIQLDGGRVRWWTDVTANLNQFAPLDASSPDPALMDFVTGASMVASRAFIERAGPMPEDYFLYYEEVDWALRRGDLPLAWCPGALVYHRAGTAIGSPAPGRPASPFSLWFKHRGRMRFLRRHFPWALPTGLAYSVAKAGQLAIGGHWAEARAVMGASLGLPPPAAVRARLSPEAQALAFGGAPRVRGRP